MSTESLLWIVGIGLVVTYIAVKVAWRAWVNFQIRKAAHATEPFVATTERAIADFFERFPRPTDVRLPMAADDYPAARPKPPSSPRSRTRKRRSYPRRRS
jgi:hypothetical protein